MGFTTIHSYRDHLITPAHISKLTEEGAKRLLQNKEKCPCPVCGKVLWCQRQLNRHKAIHVKPFMCETCGRGCVDLSTFRKHQSIHLPKKAAVVPRKPNVFRPPEELPVECGQCDKRFSTKNKMNQHVTVTHKGILHKCDSCPKEYLSRSGLKRHKKTFHYKMKQKQSPAKNLRYSCDICGKTQVAKDRMVQHVELVHLPVIESCPYSCGCTTKFGTTEEWVDHLKECGSEKLTEQSKSRCHFCGEIFRCQLLRLNHHLRKHKVFPCEYCDRSFAYAATLENHKLRHEEIKPYICSRCGKGFRQPRNLKFHSITVCGEDEEAKEEFHRKTNDLNRIQREKKKPFGCDQCSKRFTEAGSLEEHKIKRHSKPGL